MEGLNIVSYNTKKWQEEISTIWVGKIKKHDIILLEETHRHLEKDTIKWDKEWKGKSIWYKGTSRSKGVTITKENNRLQYSNEVIDRNGRFIAFDQEYERVKFFNEMNELMNLDDDMEVIIGGDYNCTLENDIDRYNCCSSADVGLRNLK